MASLEDNEMHKKTEEQLVGLAVDCIKVPDIQEIKPAMEGFELKTLRAELESKTLQLEEEQIKTGILLERVNNLSTEKDLVQNKVNELQDKVEQMSLGLEKEVEQNFNKFSTELRSEIKELRSEFTNLCSADVLVNKLEPKVAMMINTLIYQQEKRMNSWYEKKVLPIVEETSQIAKNVGVVSSDILRRADCRKEQAAMTER
eukprot:UN28543